MFRFHTRKGRRKAPDLVAFRDPLVLVCEAKVSASDLFRPAKASGESDYDCMVFLVDSHAAQQEVIQNVRSVLNGLQVTHSDVITVAPGLIAGSAFSSCRGPDFDARLVVLRVARDSGLTYVLRDSSGVLECRLRRG